LSCLWDIDNLRNSKEHEDVKRTMIEYDKRIDTLIGERDALIERIDELSKSEKLDNGTPSK
jgi:hypothetical protein